MWTYNTDKNDVKNNCQAITVAERKNTLIDDIDSDRVNLLFLGIDQSGSMGEYQKAMGTCLRNFHTALLGSKEAKTILISRYNFDNAVAGLGYKSLNNFDFSYSTGGGTALYDCICQGFYNFQEYSKTLKAEGFRVKTVFSIFSDGDDTASQNSIKEAQNCIETLNRAEITTAYIAFNGCEETAKTLGFRNILEASSGASELRRAFSCLSKSVIISSKSVAKNPSTGFFDLALQTN